MSKVRTIIVTIISVILIGAIIFFGFTPGGRSVWNSYTHSLEKQSWAEQAKMRANRTANSYNEYILKNSYVWEDNIPSDIDYSLPIVE